MTAGPAGGDGAVQTPPDASRDPGRAAYNHTRGLRFLEIRNRLTEIEEEAKRLREEQAEIEEAMFREIEQTGVTSFRVTHEGQEYTLFVRHEVRVSTLDQRAVVAWFNANGLASKVTVHHKSLEALVKEYVKRGDPIPEGLAPAVSTFDQHFIRTLKRK